MALKPVLKAVVAAIGFVVAFVLNALPVDNPWRVLLVAVVGVVTTYTTWRVPYFGPDRAVEQVPEIPNRHL